MDNAYITITLELSGDAEEELTAIHEQLRTLLRLWKPVLAYGEVRIAYQDQEHIHKDAQLESDAESWVPDDD